MKNSKILYTARCGQHWVGGLNEVPALRTHSTEGKWFYLNLTLYLPSISKLFEILTQHTEYLLISCTNLHTDVVYCVDIPLRRGWAAGAALPHLGRVRECWGAEIWPRVDTGSCKQSQQPSGWSYKSSEFLGQSAHCISTFASPEWNLILSL